MEPAGADGAGLRAWLRLGGISLVRQQLAVAQALGCERVVCLAHQFEAAMIPLQHCVEAAGASFHVVSSGRGLVSLVSAADEVVALADGLLAWPRLAIDQLGQGAAVLVQPVDGGVAAGFERLDFNHAAAGAMVVPGRLVERLAGLPADCDVFSSLQRIALQAGVAQRLLPAEAHEAGRWVLVRGEVEAHAAEVAWIRLLTQPERVAAPSLVVARQAVRALGPALLHAGSGGTVVAIAAAALTLLGLVAGWFGFAASAFLFCGGAWLIFLAAALLGKVERESLLLPRPPIDRGAAFAGTIDAALILLITWAVAPSAGQGMVARMYAPLVLVGLMRMVSRLPGGGWLAWLEDRGVLALALAGAAMLGVLGPVVLAFGLGLLGLGLAAARRPRG